METLKVDSQITFLYTDDLEKTHHFYHQIMGFSLALDQGNCRIYEITQSGFIGFCTKEEISNDHSDIILTIVTTQVDDWYQKLSSKGIAFDKKPQINEDFQIYHCYLRDPNGYLIEIQTFIDPRWNK